MTAGLPIAILGPAPQAPAYTLIGAAAVSSDSNLNPDPNAERWLNGVQVYGYPQDLPATYDPCATGSQISVKPTGSLGRTPTFGAFTVVGGGIATGRAVGFQSQMDEVKQHALTVLLAREAWAVENEFWHGTRLPAQTYLTKATSGTEPLTVLGGGTVTNPLNALALLEEAIASTGSRGVIHCAPGTLTAWASLYALRADGPVLRSNLGTIIVPGYGYDGSAPAGQTAVTGTKEWAFATPPIQMLRSAPFFVPDDTASAMDRNVNTIVWRAERHYALSWDGAPRFAVFLDRCQTAC